MPVFVTPPYLEQQLMSSGGGDDVKRNLMHVHPLPSQIFRKRKTSTKLPSFQTIKSKNRKKIIHSNAVFYFFVCQLRRLCCVMWSSICVRISAPIFRCIYASLAPTQPIQLSWEIHSQWWWVPWGWKKLRELNFHLEDVSLGAKNNLLGEETCQGRTFQNLSLLDVEQAWTSVCLPPRSRLLRSVFKLMKLGHLEFVC